jgi:pimeloyl-ACP methyl ester carboxylesterase
LVEHWQLDKPQVVGHDFGGLAALRGHFINGITYSALHLIDAVAVLPSGSPFYAHVALLRTCCASRGSFRRASCLCT